MLDILDEIHSKSTQGQAATAPVSAILEPTGGLALAL